MARIIVIVFVALCSFVVLGCSNKPPEDVVTKKIREYIPENKSQFRKFCPGTMDYMRNLKILTLEVVEYGAYDEGSSYWPVRVRVVFQAECGQSTFGGEWRSSGPIHFDEVMEWRLYRRENDFGEVTWDIRYGRW